MPEIAEVETVRNTLKKNILHKKIIKVDIYYSKMIESNINDFKNNLINEEFIDIKRIGKWLIFELKDYYLLSHLRMEGKYFIKDVTQPLSKHEHIVITFFDNTDLRYHDTRKFGRMNLIKKDDINNVEALNKQGYEPNSKQLTKSYLYNKICKKNLAIKTLLLDQTIISGLGNIYADEVLFESGINPLKKGNEITLDECQKIIDASSSIIKKAIECGGTTIRSYTSSLGVIGHYQDYLKVHKRESEKCYKCGNLIKRIKVNGRSTYYCEICQKNTKKHGGK